MSRCMWWVVLPLFAGGYVFGAVKNGFHRAGVALAHAEIDTFLELHRELQGRPKAVATVRRLAAARGARDRTRHCEIECEPNCRCTEFCAFRSPSLLRNAALAGSSSNTAADATAAGAAKTTEDALARAVLKISAVDKAVDQLRAIDQALAESNSEVLAIAKHELARGAREYPQTRTLATALRVFRMLRR